MPKRALNAAGSACRTCVSGGAKITTLPSVLAASTNRFQRVSQPCDGLGPCAHSGDAQSTRANANSFVIAVSRVDSAAPDGVVGTGRSRRSGLLSPRIGHLQAKSPADQH